MELELQLHTVKLLARVGGGGVGGTLPILYAGLKLEKSEPPLALQGKSYE